MGLRSGLIRGSTPPVDFFLVEESLRSPTRVLQVIILYELVLVTLIIIIINGISVVSGTLQKRTAPMMPSKMQILVAPCLLIPPHMNNGGEIEHSSLKIMLWKVLPLSKMRRASSRRLAFFGATNQLAISSPLHSIALLLSALVP